MTGFVLKRVSRSTLVKSISRAGRVMPYSPPRRAMSTASNTDRRAIMASGLTVMGGFAVLAFTNFPLLDNFGKVTALNIGISLISTLVLLPPLLVWADEDRGYVGAPAADALAER